MVAPDALALTPTPARVPGDELRRFPDWVAWSFARDLGAGLRVLDVACGRGYGAHLLGLSARQVTGVDLDPDAIAWAQKTFGASHVQFRLGDAASLPLSSGDADLAVSFCTLEHLRDASAFIDELHRVVAPGGRLVLATPRGSGEERLHPKDPKHAREYTGPELAALLEGRFAIDTRLGIFFAPGVEPTLRRYGDRPADLVRAGAQRVLPEVLRAPIRNMLDKDAAPMAWISAERHEQAPLQLVVARRV